MALAVNLFKIEYNNTMEFVPFLLEASLKINSGNKHTYSMYEQIEFGLYYFVWLVFQELIWNN